MSKPQAFEWTRVGLGPTETFNGRCLGCGAYIGNNRVAELSLDLCDVCVQRLHATTKEIVRAIHAEREARKRGCDE